MAVTVSGLVDKERRAFGQSTFALQKKAVTINNVI